MPRLSREGRYRFVPRVLMLASTHQTRGGPSLGTTPGKATRRWTLRGHHRRGLAPILDSQAFPGSANRTLAFEVQPTRQTFGRLSGDFRETFGRLSGDSRFSLSKYILRRRNWGKTCQKCPSDASVKLLRAEAENRAGPSDPEKTAEKTAEETAGPSDPPGQPM